MPIARESVKKKSRDDVFFNLLFFGTFLSFWNCPFYRGFEEGRSHMANQLESFVIIWRMFGGRQAWGNAAKSVFAEVGHDRVAGIAAGGFFEPGCLGQLC